MCRCTCWRAAGCEGPTGEARLAGDTPSRKRTTPGGPRRLLTLCGNPPPEVAGTIIGPDRSHCPALLLALIHPRSAWKGYSRRFDGLFDARSCMVRGRAGGWKVSATEGSRRTERRKDTMKTPFPARHPIRLRKGRGGYTPALCCRATRRPSQRDRGTAGRRPRSPPASYRSTRSHVAEPPPLAGTPYLG